MAFEKYKPWGLLLEFYGIIKLNVNIISKSLKISHLKKVK